MKNINEFKYFSCRRREPPKKYKRKISSVYIIHEHESMQFIVCIARDNKKQEDPPNLVRFVAVLASSLHVVLLSSRCRTSLQICHFVALS
jgi:hypothetical protein